MKTEDKGQYFTVSVNRGELVGLPYATWIGTIQKSDGKINVWTPAASVPRGYRQAAKRMLEEERDRLARDGVVQVGGFRRRHDVHGVRRVSTMSGYAYGYTGDGNPLRGKDDDWEIEVIDAEPAQLIGKRRIDGTEHMVLKLKDGRYVAQTSASLK